MTSPGLREKKKARTRRTIREHALRLFAARGFGPTTVGQIAEAAEVSPSTFFRYFATKEQIVLDNDVDPVMVDAVRHLPDGVAPVEGLRDAVLAALGDFDGTPEEMLLCIRLAFSEPELRASRMDHAFATQETLAAALAERLGRDAEDLELHAFAAAAVGAWGSALQAWARENGRRPLAEYVDRAMTFLGGGLRL
ncbi:acyl-CoA-like ligand-binding transcription factor [Phytomonospora endophytica]|uniref:AcrR family transcriptional regulator n=1 Tax=Phytomonospora endophytica TaxID=714109 RepID=A0A841FAV8_9ACTN|nr:TetR family transcriptional regulator [Phytomonospora endophytica]MBB6034401.1 AcrR family transcriptional regulator [Phytomonospora endophytica]GIG66795.1 TetR family transcriptional regulator [Phytomonospora endophytica]